MIILENDSLRVEVNPLGAELWSIFRKSNRREYLWNGDPAWWSSRAPILFPFIARVKDGWYRYQGKVRAMMIHGFAQHMEFAVEEQSATRVVLSIHDDEETRVLYPFRFVFRVIFEIGEDQLSQRFEVENRTDGEMYFSVGGHPAFCLPREDGEKLEDIYVQFDSDEEMDRINCNEAVYYLRTVTPGFIHGREKKYLAADLFRQDAWAFHDFSAKHVSILSAKSGHGVRVDISEFPYVGIWQKPGAPYLCVEPWCGIADYNDTRHELTQKDGINRLDKGGSFAVGFSIELV